MFKDAKKNKSFTTHKDRPGAKLAELRYEVMHFIDGNYLLKIDLYTGRHQQIRAQLANIGLPIIGDEKYGSDQEYLPLSICLHAWKLAYEVSGSKEPDTFEAPLPNDDFWTFKSI